MGFFSRSGRIRFIDSDSHRSNLEAHFRMIPRTLAGLYQGGVPDHSCLALDFSFYTDSAKKGDLLSRALMAKGYSAECGPAADARWLFVISGWSTPVSVTESALLIWTRQMCELGYDHDCEFDRWGTTPAGG